jgi:predicted TPR repeat methyltransferase
MQAKSAAEGEQRAETLRQAMQAHGAGRFDAAQDLYRQVLAEDGEHPDALHLLGVLRAQRGCHAEAAELIARAVTAAPAEAMFRNNLGNVQAELGRIDEAEACYLRAIELDPSRLDAMNNLGVLLSRRGDAAGAERLLAHVVDTSADFADARQNLANHYLRNGELNQAVRECTNGLVVAPRHPALRRTLGLAYSMLGMKAQAVAVYRAWLQAEPDNALADFHLRACTGESVPERAPDRYVTQVFDGFAASFDAKLADLGYQAPALAVAAVRRHLGEPARALDVLDAGCGTGLCGPRLAPWARSLAGVDLSAGMLRKALARSVYDELLCGELGAFLASCRQAWDLIVSTDTLIYFGALEGVFAGAAAALRRGGWLVFTLEAHADDSGGGYLLHEHGRYSHSRHYVEAALRDAGLELVALESVVLRQEAQQPVQGWLTTARNAGPN